MSPETSINPQAQVDQELLETTFRGGERHESLTTSKTLRERKRGESSDRDNEPTPRTIRAFEEIPRKDDRKSSSVDKQLRARKPSDPKPSNNNIDRNTTNQKRGKYQSTSSSDSEGREENEKISRFQRKRSNLEEGEEEESTMKRLQLNSADRNSRSITLEYEEDNKTCRSFTGEKKISHAVRSNDLDNLVEKHKEYADSDKDFISRNRHCLKGKKSHTNRDSSYSDGEQEVRRSAHEEQGGGKRQGTPAGNTDRQQRSRSRSVESDKNPSNENNRKSRHYHHHHRHRRHHRHHRNRSSPPSENRAEKQRNRDSTS